MSRALNNHPVLLAWLSCLWVACGPGVEEGPLFDSDEPDTDTGADTASTFSDSDTADAGTDSESSDPENGTDAVVPFEWCNYPTIEETAALKAVKFSAGATIAAMGDNCALLSEPVTDGYALSVVFMSAYADDNVLSVAEETVSLPPRGITCRFDPLSKIFTAYVLASDDTHSTVLAVQDESAVWTPVFSGPSMNGIHLMVRTAEPAVDEVCLFGDGMFCAPRTPSPMTWREELAAGSGGQFRDTVLIGCETGWCPVVVGDGGDIRFRDAGGWQKIQSGTGADLLSVSDNGEVFTAVGRGGTLIHGNAEGIRAYVILDGRDLLAVDWKRDRFFMGAASDGTVFEGEIRADGVFLCPGPDAVEGPIQDAKFFNCDGELNYLVLRPDALLGRYECVPVTIV